MYAYDPNVEKFNASFKKCDSCLSCINFIISDNDCKANAWHDSANPVDKILFAECIILLSVDVIFCLNLYILVLKR